jgi:hypothetical protein
LSGCNAEAAVTEAGVSAPLCALQCPNVTSAAKATPTQLIRLRGVDGMRNIQIAPTEVLSADLRSCCGN